MPKISIAKIMLGEISAPLLPGTRLEEVGRFLGPPKWWNFGREQQFTCLLGYGDLEFSFTTQDDKATLRRIGIYMWDAIDGIPQAKSRDMKITRGFGVNLDGFEPGIAVEEAKLLLKALSLPCIERDEIGPFEVAKRLIIPQRAILNFFRSDAGPKLMEMHFLIETDT